MKSLRRKGTPAKGPSGMGPRAAARAASYMGVTTAFRRGLSASMRVMAASTNSVALTSFLRTSAACAVASSPPTSSSNPMAGSSQRCPARGPVPPASLRSAGRTAVPNVPVEFPGAPFDLPNDEVLPGVRDLPVGAPERIPPHLDGRIPIPLDLDRVEGRLDEARVQRPLPERLDRRAAGHHLAPRREELAALCVELRQRARVLLAERGHELLVPREDLRSVYRGWHGGLLAVAGCAGRPNCSCAAGRHGPPHTWCGLIPSDGSAGTRTRRSGPAWLSRAAAGPARAGNRPAMAAEGGVGLRREAAERGVRWQTNTDGERHGGCPYRSAPG